MKIYSKMDKLEFTIQSMPGVTTPYQCVTISVNGLDLISMIKAYELPLAKKEGTETLAGGYDWLEPEQLVRNLTRASMTDQDETEKVSILDCGCGCDDCWPMKVKVTERGDEIIWSDFEQPHRSAEHQHFWDYSDFGPFYFGRDAYYAQLDKCKNSLPASVSKLQHRDSLEWGQVTPEATLDGKDEYFYIYNHDLSTPEKVDRTIRFIIGRLNYYDLHLPEYPKHFITIDIRGQQIADHICDFIRDSLKNKYQRSEFLKVDFVKE